MQDINDLFDIGGQDPSQVMSLANQGQKALASGAISPAQAKAVQKKLGLDNPKAQDYLASYLGGDQSSPYVFGAKSSSSPPAAKVAGKGTQTKNTNTTSQEDSSKTNRNTYEGVGDIMSMARGLPEIQSQSQGISDMQAQLDKLRASKSTNDSWVKPLLALSDSVNGGHQADSFMPAQEKKNANLEKFANELQQRRSDLSKTLLDSIAKMKTGSDQNALNNKSGTNIFLGTGMNQGGLNSSRLLAMPLRAGNDFDKQLAPATKAVESFNNGEDLLNNKNIPLTENNLNMIQQDISNGLSASGNATDSKLAMDMMHAVQGTIANAKLKYTGTLKPEDDLRLAIPDIVDQIHKVLQNVRSSYSDRVNRQADQIAKTYESSYDDIPNLRETVEAKKAAIAARFPKSKSYSITGAEAAPLVPPAGGGGDVRVSNGKETHIIHAGATQEKDLADAATEGYKVVK